MGILTCPFEVVQSGVASPTSSTGFTEDGEVHMSSLSRGIFDIIACFSFRSSFVKEYTLVAGGGSFPSANTSGGVGSTKLALSSMARMLTVVAISLSSCKE